MPSTIGVSVDNCRLIELNPAERRFELPTVPLAALEWGAAGDLPVLALHGWLDNAGSFSLLAPRLPGCHLIAVDAAGHGFSAHRSPDSGYNIWQDLGDILELADQLGWSRFSLIGHSRGAAIASLFAATFPDRIERLMLLEGGLPLIGDAADAPSNLARVLQRTRELRDRAGRVFAEREQAIAERVNGFSPVSVEAAEILAVRSLVQAEGGWRWQADQRLKAGSEWRLTQDQLLAFLDRIASPTLCFLAEQSPFANLPLYKETLPRIAGIEIHRLPGRHHFHMEGAEATIAEGIREFLASH